MPEYLAPGVYVEETSFRSKSIEGVSTTTTGFIGPTRYGPVNLEPEIITSLGEFERAYGDGNRIAYGETKMDNYVYHAARAFYTEGGKRLYVSRVFRPLDAAETGKSKDGYASSTIGGVEFRARYPGSYGNFTLRLTMRAGRNILGQVRLLRQISAEFSSFASSPTPRPVEASLADLVHEVVEPYRVGLAGRVSIVVTVAPALPSVRVDRLLMARALTNVVENALHAMPGGGTLTVTADLESDGRVALRVVDTGVGMDDEALARIFEPYFSTKATGTGLGLTIAKRNTEASGGTIHVASKPGRGTTVTMILEAVGGERK